MGTRSGIQAGDLISLLRQNHALECFLNLVCLAEKRKPAEEKMILSAAVYVSPKPAYSVLMVPSLMCTYAPPCHHWCWLLKFVLIRNLMVALFFSLEDNIFHWAKVATFFRSYLYVATLFPLLVKANSRALTYVSKPMKLFILKKLSFTPKTPGLS